MKSTIVKRTIKVGGRKTSVTLEDEFWVALREIARDHRTTAYELVTLINAGRYHANLSSAIRIFVLGFYRDQAMSRSGAKLIERLDIYRLPLGKSP